MAKVGGDLIQEFAYQRDQGWVVGAEPTAVDVYIAMYKLRTRQTVDMELQAH